MEGGAISAHSLPNCTRGISFVFLGVRMNRFASNAAWMAYRHPRPLVHWTRLTSVACSERGDEQITSALPLGPQSAIRSDR